MFLSFQQFTSKVVDNDKRRNCAHRSRINSGVIGFDRRPVDKTLGHFVTTLFRRTDRHLRLMSRLGCACGGFPKHGYSPVVNRRSGLMEVPGEGPAGVQGSIFRLFFSRKATPPAAAPRHGTSIEAEP